MAFGITPVVVADAVVDEVPRIFNDALENQRRGQPDFIANGNPESIVGKVAQAVSRSACRAYGAGNLNLGASKAQKYEEACRPYLDGVAPGNGAGIAKPFDGGQCDALYIVSWSGTTRGGLGTYNARAKTWGPLGGARSVDRGDGRFNIEFLSSGGLIATTLCSGTNPSKGPYQYRQLGTTGVLGPDDGGSFTILEACAGSDSCGNPPPEVIQPRPIPDPTGPSFEFNPAPDIDIDVDVDVLPDGTINVNIGTGPINVDPFPDGGGGSGGGGSPPVSGEPGGSSDTGSGGEGGEGGSSEGDAPAGKVLTGVRIDILEYSPSRSRFTSEVDRGVAYVYMGTPTEGLGLEPTGSLVKDGQFFFAQKDYLTRWSVRAKFGYNLRTTPYYKDAPT